MDLEGSHLDAWLAYEGHDHTFPTCVPSEITGQTEIGSGVASSVANKLRIPAQYTAEYDGTPCVQQTPFPLHVPAAESQKERQVESTHKCAALEK